MTAAPAPYAGLATRGVAFVIDAVIAHVVVLLAAALVWLVTSIVGELRPEWLANLIAGVAWIVFVALYFVCFWTTGQTPGMRAMGVRVLGRDDAPPTFVRSLVRLVGLVLAIVPFFAGFLPVLFDDRRRALQDFLAGTVVVYADRESLLVRESDAAEGRTAGNAREIPGPAS
jgi:uncharacterized RDD family membrane protein YckC